jgi:hypothetical protein
MYVGYMKFPATIHSPKPRRLRRSIVLAVAARAECDPRTAERALIKGAAAIHGIALSDRLADAIRDLASGAK